MSAHPVDAVVASCTQETLAALRDLRDEINTLEEQLRAGDLNAAIAHPRLQSLASDINRSIAYLYGYCSGQGMHTDGRIASCAAGAAVFDGTHHGEAAA
ncbi:hypothetical protein [Corynebacterium argentoratense]|uniref:hypothetical protein n=1 Tax=Corynebacterium argentoratense TaxID=42817 RepID=UPI001F26085F|nr:hypothetical protein [Corynebacterium argentoratense]MCF1712704.1 hypothetical protein [Corynebacterium argentoratense]